MRVDARTIAYMKRRARRDLKTLAKSNAERFVRVAAETLLTGKGMAEIDPAVHWVAMDLLFGGGGRYYQAKHGRGRRSRKGAAPSFVETA